jgi:hypothetical protein
MTHSAEELSTCTGEQLQEAIAGLLGHGRGKVLSDTEVQEFWQVYHEIHRRSASTTFVIPILKPARRRTTR